MFQSGDELVIEAGTLRQFCLIGITVAAAMFFANLTWWSVDSPDRSLLASNLNIFAAMLVYTVVCFPSETRLDSAGRLTYRRFRRREYGSVLEAHVSERSWHRYCEFKFANNRTLSLQLDDEIKARKLARYVNWHLGVEDEKT